jgi:hypothetical protein
VDSAVEALFSNTTPRVVEASKFSLWEKRLDRDATHLLYGPVWWSTGPLSVYVRGNRITLSDGDDWYVYSPLYESKSATLEALHKLATLPAITPKSKTRLLPQMLAADWYQE